MCARFKDSRRMDLGSSPRGQSVVNTGGVKDDRGEGGWGGRGTSRVLDLELA